MEDNQDPSGAKRPAVTTHTMEIVVALLFFVFGSGVAFDSYRLGARWAEDGPQSGYFPFYIGVIICISSIVTLLQAFTGKAAVSKKIFVEWGQLKLMLAVLAPAALYVLGIQLIGIYVSSVVYITLFMAWLGNYSWFKSAALALTTSVSFFVLFEIWFKVPLFKGVFNPLDFLGY